MTRYLWALVCLFLFSQSVVATEYTSFGKGLDNFIKNNNPPILRETINEGFFEDPQGLPPAVQAYWHSVVRIHITAGKEAAAQGFKSAQGSGIVVKVDAENRTAIIATNSHVVNKKNEQGQKRGIDQKLSFRTSIVFFDDTGKNYVTSELDVIADAPYADLALVKIKLPKEILPSVPKFKAVAKASGEDVFGIGFPDVTLRTEWLNGKPEHDHSSLQRYSKGIAVRKIEGAVQKIYHDADTLPGSSGGPLFNKNGELIGIASMGSRTDTDTYAYCSHAYVTEEIMYCPMVAISVYELIRLMDGT